MILRLVIAAIYRSLALVVACPRVGFSSRFFLTAALSVVPVRAAFLFFVIRDPKVETFPGEQTP